MAIIRSAAVLLLREALKRPFSGVALTLGRTRILLTEADWKELASREGFQLHEAAHQEFEDCQLVQGGVAISDHYFFESLGFTELHAMDNSDFEDADFIHDLNSVPAPKPLRDRFDVIFNYGTIEHVFHVPNALQNIHDMLKVGGRVIHAAPTSNHPDHGFYMLSPCWFVDYYTANRYDIADIKVVRFREKTMFKTAEFLDYPKDGSLGWSTGSFDDQVYGVVATLVKTADSQAHLIPQQNCYQQLWNEHNSTTPLERSSEKDLAEQQPVSLIRRCYRRVKNLPLIGGLARMAGAVARRLVRTPRLKWTRIPE